MVQKLAFALAAVSAITLGSTLSASAMNGGHASFHAGVMHHAFGFHDHFAFRHHRFFRDRFFFADGPYIYDDGCYQRVWTRWGWRWISVCY